MVGIINHTVTCHLEQYCTRNSAQTLMLYFIVNLARYVVTIRCQPEITHV